MSDAITKITKLDVCRLRSPAYESMFLEPEGPARIVMVESLFPEEAFEGPGEFEVTVVFRPMPTVDA